MTTLRYLLGAVVISGFLSAFASSASALDCADPLDHLDKMDLVVHVRIAEVPESQWAKLRVERYYRGRGPAELLVEFRGLGRDYDWALTPQPDVEALMELGHDQEGYYVQPCALYMKFTDNRAPKILSLLGEGSPPTPPTPSNPPGQVKPPPDQVKPPEAGKASPFSWVIFFSVILGMAAAVGGVLRYRRKG